MWIKYLHGNKMDYYENEDNDGEMFFGFYNLGKDTILISKGDKLGQRYIYEIFKNRER